MVNESTKENMDTLDLKSNDDDSLILKRQIASLNSLIQDLKEEKLQRDTTYKEQLKIQSKDKEALYQLLEEAKNEEHDLQTQLSEINLQYSKAKQEEELL